MSTGSCTEDQACAAALAWLGMSPARLRRLFADATARQAWDSLVAGTHPQDPEGRLRALADPALPERLARRCEASGIAVRVLGSPDYPRALALDGQAPAVLFTEGRIDALELWPRVAVVGTRSATATGRAVAQAMGDDLARADVSVVSGGADGIDAAALTGASSLGTVGPVAVIGSAHDDWASPQQRRLRRAVAERGAVLSEIPPGAATARWRFAVRNRIMAALADVVVVVECHARGGALHTVAAARRRAKAVAAIPGSVQSPASEGANALLVEGAHCVRHSADVIDLLTRLTGWAPEVRTAHGAAERGDGREDLDPVARSVLAALEQDPASLDAIVLRTGAGLGEVALALERLVAAGLARAESGFWAATRARGRRGQRRVARAPAPWRC